MFRFEFLVITAALCSKAISSYQESTLDIVDSSLVNKSLIFEDAHNHEKDAATKDDMWSMVASMQSDTSSMSVAEYNEHNYEHTNSKEKFHHDWHVKLDETNKYRLEWTVNYASNEVIFSLQVNESASQFSRGSDIFALGFSSYGQLESSDFCIIWYDLGHRIHLQDARTDSKKRLKLVSERKSFCRLLQSEKPADKNQDDERDNIPVAGLKADHNELMSDESEDSSADNNNLLVELAKFRRPLDTCDDASSDSDNQHYYRIDNGTTHLVWFTIKGPLLSLDDLDLNQLSMQTSRHHDHMKLLSQVANPTFESGLKRVQLVATKTKRLNKSDSRSHNSKSSSHDIRMDHFVIPGKETTYWCKLFRLPHKFESRKYHITKYEAVIETGNEHIVHHMELFDCANLDANQESELDKLHGQQGGWSGDCASSQRPAATLPCRKVIMAWAMGAHPLEYPEEVGQAIGGRDYSPFVVLEVHYNNVKLQRGLVDSSGLRFQYSSKLRPYDAGVLEVGLEYTDKNSVPPRMVAPLAGHCVSECTRVAMSQQTNGNRGDDQWAFASSTGAHLTGSKRRRQQQQREGIYIFAAQMHTHLVGVASWTEQVRGGEVIGELQRDNHYSPHFQEIRLLPEPIYLAPGDALVHYCLYDTRTRPNITLGGFATSDEMCVTYLHYYPRVDLEVCKSSVDTQALGAHFARLANEESQPTSDSESVAENYRSIEWSPRRSRELLEFYQKAPLSVQCNRSNGDRYPGYWDGIPPTSIWHRSEKALGRLEVSAQPSGGGDDPVAYRGRDASLIAGRHAQCSIKLI